MIAGQFHVGSGMGNQLARYVMTRVLALDNNVDFGMVNPENFKGSDFMDLDMGEPADHLLQGNCYVVNEKSEKNDEGNEVRDYDENFLNWKMAPGMDYLIDGEFQGEKYYEHRLKEIDKWLAVEPLDMPRNICVIGFRGGEYVGVPDLFLPVSYWQEAIRMMQTKYPRIIFEVHTDDPVTAERFFPDYMMVSDIEMNWRAVRYAKHLIIANSSFYILPALLNEDVKEIISPRFWAGHNKGYWQLKQNQYNKFTYI